MKKMQPAKVFDYSNLRGYIREKGYYEKEVAEKAGMTPSTFCKILSGQRPMDSLTITRISEMLKISPDEVHMYFLVKARKGAM